MKIDIKGASNFVNRMFEACGNFQWAREFLKNSLEAQAKRIEFGLEWQAVEFFGHYRRTICDDGIGMTGEELLNYFSTLGAGSKQIGGVHDNFGVGARIASLPWNPEGVVVISSKDDEQSMIWIVLDPNSGDYELVEFETVDGSSCVVDPREVDWPDVDWAEAVPEWGREHGTTIVLLGSEDHPDTILGNPDSGEADIKGLSVYLNTRFWDLHSSDIEVRVLELRSERKTSWPEDRNDRDDGRRPNLRTIRGAGHYIDSIKFEKGELKHSGRLDLVDGRVGAHWYLWEGDRPAIHSYAKKGGYIAVRYKGELFQLTDGKVPYRWFGVIEGDVQRNLWIILDPALLGEEVGRWGVHPDQSRNRLIFTGDGNKGVDLPLSDWGLEFAEHLPDEILAAIRAARGAQSSEVTDEEYRKRLQDKFGDRWKMRTLYKSKATPKGAEPTGDPEGEEEAPPEVIVAGPRGKKIRRIKRPVTPNKRTRAIRMKLREGDSDVGQYVSSAVDVPRIEMAGADEFEKDWHIALWVPRHPEGPTVLINRESPILQEIVEYHQDQYPAVHAEEVGKTVRQVFGEIAACKIAHSQKLAKKVPEEELDRTYRSEAALTVGVMGLIAEEAVIAQRLGKLGRKKPA